MAEKTLRIVVDPGHEGGTKGLDPGAVNGTRKEAVAALAIAKKVGSLLKSKGHQVKYTRTKDKEMTLQQRCDISNDFSADVFVSIHLNASTNDEAEGIETWRYKNVSEKTKRLADNVQTQLVAMTGSRNRGVKTSESLYVLKHTKASAVLVECGFISNTAEAKSLFCEKCQNRIAQGIVTGIERAFA